MDNPADGEGPAGGGVGRGVDSVGIPPRIEAQADQVAFRFMPFLRRGEAEDFSNASEAVGVHLDPLRGGGALDDRLVRTAFISLSLFAIPHGIWRTVDVVRTRWGRA